MRSFSVTMTPLPVALVAVANLTAWRRLAGPSAETAVEGRIDPTNTTGLLHDIVESTKRLEFSVLSGADSTYSNPFDSRKKADSSIVSVPCVMTNPATLEPLEHKICSACFAKWRRIVEFMDSEPILLI
jgi:hypothetical protein